MATVSCATVPALTTTRFETFLRADPFYLGTREAPLSEAELDELTEEFVQAVNQVFPGICVHFEDWKGTDAIRMLDRYKDKMLCYNDDIQGTASIALAGIAAGLKQTGGKLQDQRILFLGAGSAALGISKLIAAELQTSGMSAEEARKRVRLFDVNGLIESSRTDLSETQKLWAQKEKPSTDFLKVVESFKPTILIGVSTKARAFTKAVIEAMTRLNERPIIFALSNPTHKAECTAEQAYTWSKGKALFAAGVQFDAVAYEGKTYPSGPGQQLLRLPRYRIGDLRRPPDPPERPVLHRRSPCHSRSGRSLHAGQGHAVPEPGPHSRNGDHHRDPHRRIHVRRRPRHGRASARAALLDRKPALHTFLLKRSDFAAGGTPTERSRHATGKI